MTPEEKAFKAQRIGMRFKDLRLKAKLTQNQLAQKAGISQTDVSNIERGIAKQFRPDAIAALNKVFGTKIRAPGRAFNPASLQNLKREPASKGDTISVRIPPSLKKRVVAKARIEGITIKSVVEKALKEFVKT